MRSRDGTATKLLPEQARRDNLHNNGWTLGRYSQTVSSLQQLTVWTKMRTALTHQGVLNRGTTATTGLAGMPVDAEEILIIACRINPINGRAVVLNAFL